MLVRAPCLPACLTEHLPTYVPLCGEEPQKKPESGAPPEIDRHNMRRDSGGVWLGESRKSIYYRAWVEFSGWYYSPVWRCCGLGAIRLVRLSRKLGSWIGMSDSGAGARD